MKVLGKFLLSMSVMGMVAAPAQAQIWTNSSGIPWLNGTAVTLSGEMVVSMFGFPKTTCDVSVDGTITAPNVITFTQATPGFVTDCPIGVEADFEFPFNLRAEHGSPTGKVAAAYNINLLTAVGTCHAPVVKLAWSNAPTSQGVLVSNVSAAPCVLHSGSYLKAVGNLAGNLSIL